MDDFDIAQSKIGGATRTRFQAAGKARGAKNADAKEKRSHPRNLLSETCPSGGDEHLPSPRHRPMLGDTGAQLVDDFAKVAKQLAGATGKALETISGPWLGPVANPAGQLAVLLLLGVGTPLVILWITIEILGPVKLVEGTLLAAGAKFVFGAIKRRLSNGK